MEVEQAYQEKGLGCNCEERNRTNQRGQEVRSLGRESEDFLSKDHPIHE